MPSVSLESGRNHTTRCTLKGKLSVTRPVPLAYTTIGPDCFSYVELLEQQQAQLVGGLQELYRRTVTGHGWPGLPLQDSGNGHPLTHDILERLGVLETEGSGESDSFEEDLELMQQRLLEGGSGFARRQDPSDSESEHTPTPNPFFEPCASTGALFHETFPMRQMPPTPPLHSPYHASNRPTSLMQPLDHSVSHLQLAPGNGHASMNPAILQQQSWCSSPAAYMENMEYTTQVESPPVCHGMSAADLHRPWLAMNAISPRAAMADWTEEDFNAFLNPSIMV